MKRQLLITLFLISGILVMAQATHQHKVFHPSGKNLVLKKPFRNPVKINGSMLDKRMNPTVKSSLTPSETDIGDSRYDLQSNQSVPNRIYRYDDGSIAAVWTRGANDPSFSERGSGYNYFDGSSWGPSPTARIETVRTGWPTISPLDDGEIVISHTDYDGLSVAKRATKGTGTWIESVLPGPAGAVDISWPRTVTSGPDHNQVNVIATTYVVYQGMDLPLMYYRSLDGGATWDKEHLILPGMTSSEYVGFGGDTYAWAEPKGDTLAFVVGDNWTDVILMKSTDGGDNWTKTVIFQHPYPMFRETSTLVLDTPTVCDGAVAVALDKQGYAHVAFGIMRVLNDDTLDGVTSYFPYSDGLAYWNEHMPTMTSVKYEDLEAQGRLAGHVLDLNNNDTVLEFVDVAVYYLSVTSMPNITIDEDNNIFIVMASVMEGMDNGNQNYRHILARATFDQGASWTGIVDITGSILHNFDECVFPSIAASSDDKLHLIFQKDDEPGMAVRGDEDPYGDNTIIYMSVPKTDLGVGIGEKETTAFQVLQNYPNPVTEHGFIPVNLGQPATLSLTISNSLGQVVYQADMGQAGPGTRYFTVDANILQPGIYFYTVTANRQSVTRKMVVQ